MCGIAGIALSDPAAAVDPATIRAMCDAIRHRGPDDDGIHCAGPVGIGMRRLSIIDVGGGHQPIFNEDRSAAIVFNGEIYNYRELQPALRAHGHHFRSTGDTETVLHLFEERGPACVDELRGMFAFAIWDERHRRLLLARDRFGIKPLYYAEGPWGIAFASELKALLAAGISDRILDRDALDAYFTLGYLPAPFTPFADVRKLPPGHLLTWRPGEPAVLRRYWDLPSERSEPPRDPPARVREALDDAVAAHLVSDVPVAAFLSGGLDSSAVVSSMALQDGAPHAFSVRYQGSGAADADETPLAAELARRYGARHTIVNVAPRVEEVLEPIVRALDEPHADDSALPTWLLSEAVAAEYKVALTGIGGDELFGGYRRHLALRWSDAYARVPRGVRRAIAAAVDHLPEPRSAHLGVDRLKRFARSGDGGTAERYLAMVTRLRNEERRALFAPAFRDSISGTAASRHFAARYADGGAPSGLSAALYLDYKTFLPDDILALSDRLSMAHGLEIRVPFVDHRLVETVFPLPDRTKVGWGRPKALLRAALRTRLPAAHFRAPKRGFVGPTAHWLRHELQPMLRDELSPARLGRLGLFDPPMVQTLLEDHFTRRHNRESILWALLCFSIWHRLTCEVTPATRTAALTRA